LKIGKVPETILKRSVFKQLNVKREEVIVGPSIGMDCSAIQFDNDEVCVISCDPITGAVKDIGSLAVHITANDIAASGGEPIGLMLTIMLPLNFPEGDLKQIMKDVNTVCNELNIEVLGGHTEVTPAVNQPIISVAGIGKVIKEKLVTNNNASVGQDIIMTKWAGIEGTSIIAHEKENELKEHYNPSFIDQAKSLGKLLSVIKESKISVEHGVSAMHDVTEGGIFGGLWELAECSNVGLEIYLDKIPLKQETIEICEYYDLNPYKLISSGSMLIAANNGIELVNKLEEANVKATIIGKVVKGNDRIVIQSDTRRSLEPAKSDELYKVFN
jgi:hydrogenase maturation factor